MERIQNSAVEDYVELDNIKLKNKDNSIDKNNKNKLPKKVKPNDEIEKRKTTKRWKERDNEQNETPYDKYSREANLNSGGSGDTNNINRKNNNHRTKRATRPKEENKNTCSLFIQTDPLIWRHISEQVCSLFVFNIACTKLPTKSEP